mgnify:CR=1 FL=1
MATVAESRPLADLQEEALIRVEEEWARRAKGARPWSTAEYLDQVAAEYARVEVARRVRLGRVA